MYKYYSVIRPISIGTIPDCTIREVVNFNQRQYVEEIMRQAWGYFLTPDEIPEEKLQAYSLVSADIIHELQQVRETLVKKEIIVDSVAAETIDRRILITKEED